MDGPIANPLAYLYRAADMLMIDRYRSRRQAELREQDWVEGEGPSRSPAPNAQWRRARPPNRSPPRWRAWGSDRDRLSPRSGRRYSPASGGGRTGCQYQHRRKRSPYGGPCAGRAEGTDRMSQDRLSPAHGVDTVALDWALRMADPARADWDAFTDWLEADPAMRAVRPGGRDPAGRRGGAVGAARGRGARRDRAGAGARATASAALDRRGHGGGADRAIGVSAWQDRPQPYAVETAAGETRRIPLSDGSSVTLAGLSRVELDHAERAGRCWLAARRCSRCGMMRSTPCGSGRALALVDLGTVFDVRMGGQTRVAVAEGAVMVDPKGAALRLDAGQAVTVDGDRLTRSAVEPEEVGGWREGRLAFDGAPLGMVGGGCVALPGPAGDGRARHRRAALPGDDRPGSGPARSGGAGAADGCEGAAGGDRLDAGTARVRSIGGGIGCLVAVVAAMPATAADRVSLDLPAGTVGAQVMALGRVARANIVVPDAGLWRRPVPALRGALSVEQALAAIARGSGARVEALGPGSWRLTPRLRSPAPKPKPRPRRQRTYKARMSSSPPASATRPATTLQGRWCRWRGPIWNWAGRAARRSWPTG